MSQVALISRESGIQPLKAGLICLVAASLTMVIPRMEHIAIYVVVFAMGMCWMIPFWKQWQAQSLDYFEPIHLLGFLYLVYFGLGAIWVVGDPEVVAYDWYVLPYILKSSTYCLLGYLTMLLGYYGLWPGRRAKLATEEYPQGTMFLLIPAGLGILGWTARIMWFESVQLGFSLPSVMSSLAQLSPLFIFGWSLSWLLYFSRKATPAHKLILFGGLVPAALLIGLNALNNKSMIVSIAGVPLIALWYTRRKIPWLLLLIMLLVLIFVIFPFNNTFRTLDYHIPTTERISMSFNLMRSWDMDFYMERSLGTFKYRMALINMVAVVVRDVPRWVPYAQGRTIFMPMLVFSIPRFLWPDKPVEYFGREFGETFRMVHILDSKTTVAASIPGELYWNFSLAGILVGMALWGVLMRWLYRRYGESSLLDPVRRAIFIVVLIQLVHFESGISVPMVELIRILVILEGYRWCARYFGLIDVRAVDAQTALPGSR